MLLEVLLEVLRMPRRRQDDASPFSNLQLLLLLLPLHLLVVRQPVPRHRNRLDAEPPDLPVGPRRGRVCRPGRAKGNKAVVFSPARGAVLWEVDVEDLAPLAEVGSNHRLGDGRGNAADVDSGA